MALNFPDPATQTPVNTFSPTSTPDASTNGITYLWDGQKWNAQTNGDAAFWQRVGTTLSPATAGDNISTTGDISSADVTASSEVKAPSLLNAATTGDPNITLNADGSTLIRDLQNTANSLIINGAMAVAQRSTAPVADFGYQSVDRWAISHSGSSGSVTQTQGSAGGPTGFPTYFRMTNSSTTAAANGFRQIYQYIEGQNVMQSGWDHTDPNSKLTLSFKVRASISQLYYGRLYTDDGAQQGFPFRISKSDGTAIDADTWTDVSVVIPGNANITIDNDNGVGLGVIFTPHYGPDLTDNAVVLDTWAAFDGAALSPDYATTWGSTLNATFDITGVQLTATDAPIEFQREDYGTTLRKCQRYYATNYDGTYPLDNSTQTKLNLMLPWAASPNSTVAVTESVLFSLKTTMRAAPTVTTVAPDGTAGSFFANSSTVTLRGADGTTNQARIFLNGSGTFASGVVNASAEL